MREENKQVVAGLFFCVHSKYRSVLKECESGLALKDTTQEEGEDFLAAERNQGALEIVEIKSPVENSDDVNLLEQREDMEDERKVLKHGCESPKIPSLSIKKVRTGEDITHKVKKAQDGCASAAKDGSHNN